MIGVISSCRHARRHEHATHLGWRCGCRCDDCVKAARRWNKHRSVLGGFVDAEFSRRWLRELVDSGVSLETLSHASGLSVRTLKRIYDGDVKRVQLATQAAVLGLGGEQLSDEETQVDAAEFRNKLEKFIGSGAQVTRVANLVEMDARGLKAVLNGKTTTISKHQHALAQDLSWTDLKPGCGATRRLQALAVSGWTLGHVAELSGLDVVRLSRIQNGAVANVSAAEFDAIWSLTKQLASVYPQGEVHDEIRKQAHECGWRSLAAFNNPDDPTCVPSAKYSKATLNEVIEDLTELAELGYGLTEAKRRGMTTSESALERRLQRAGANELLAKLKYEENRLSA